MVEYGLIIALIAVVVVAALVIFGPKIAKIFTDVGGQLDPKATPSPTTTA
jgi:pilus assembly protein Flp/PilA